MIAVIACVLVTYGLAEVVGASGAIAALTLGFVLGNRGSLGLSRLAAFGDAGERAPRYVLWFLSDIIFLLKTFFFVYLGISVRFADWRLGAVAVLAVIAVYLTRAADRTGVDAGSTSRPDARVMAVLGPKGLAAAVLAGVPLQWASPRARRSSSSPTWSCSRASSRPRCAGRARALPEGEAHEPRVVARASGG